MNYFKRLPRVCFGWACPSIARRIMLSLVGSLTLVGWTLATLAAQDDFLIALRDGTLLRATLQTNPIPWRRVGANNNVSSDELRLDQVQRIEFARLPASRQLVEIRQLLGDLQSDNYHVRNNAEKSLIERGGQFIDVLTAAQENDNAEVRYRIGRVLKRLQAQDAKRIDAEFDLVVLTSGEAISGDLEFESLVTDLRGRTVELPRDSIAALTRVTDAATTKPPRPLETRSFSKPLDVFYQAGDVHINFDAGRLNESFNKFEDIHQAFVYRGVRLSADCGEEPATVVTAGFAIDQGRSKRNSAATLMTRTNKKYLGALRVNFCEPNNANVPATVFRVGCYIALVDHPRDFVLEAYSVDNQIVASAEALEKSAFMGVESTIPIAYVRIQPNRNLTLDPAEQDQNFVIDDLTFDPPQATTAVPVADQATLYTTDGSRFVCSSIEFDGQVFMARIKAPLDPSGSAAPLSFSQNEVAAITFPSGLGKEPAAGLWGCFPDGSFLPLTIAGTQMSSRDFDQWKFDRSDLLGICGSKTTLQYPLSEDLAAQQVIVARPAERWLMRDIKIGTDKLSWDQSAAQLREIIKREGHNPDTTAEFALSDAPSIWWHAPIDPAANQGWLRTRDGRTFALGGASRITVEELGPDGVALARSSQQIRIPWAEIRAVRFLSR